MMVAGMNGITQAVNPAIRGLPVTALNIMAPQSRLMQVPNIRLTIENPFQLERSSMPKPVR